MLSATVVCVSSACLYRFKPWSRDIVVSQLGDPSNQLQGDKIKCLSCNQFTAVHVAFQNSNEYQAMPMHRTSHMTNANLLEGTPTHLQGMLPQPIFLSSSMPQYVERELRQRGIGFSAPIPVPQQTQTFSPAMETASQLPMPGTSPQRDPWSQFNGSRQYQEPGFGVSPLPHTPYSPLPGSSPYPGDLPRPKLFGE